MNRAQLIRQKRLIERQLENLEVVKTKTMFDWVLDLFEHPSNGNTADAVYLYESEYGEILIGSSFDLPSARTGRSFDYGKMKKLAERFNEEEGYAAEYCPRELFVRYANVKIIIK